MAAVSDIRLLVAFRDHPKRQKLQRRLGPAGALALIDLWLWAGANRPDGNLGQMDAEDVEIAAGWVGTDGAFLHALLDLRFLDRDEDGSLLLHNWSDRQRWASSAQSRSDAARAAVDAREAKRRPGRSSPRPDPIIPPAAIRSSDSGIMARGDDRIQPAEPDPIIPDPDPDPDPETKKQKTAAKEPAAVSASLPLVLPKPKKPKADPLPFSAEEALRAASDQSGGRFLLPERIKGGYAMALIPTLRAYPKLAQWAEVGRWLAAGGEAWRGPVMLGVFVSAVGDWFPHVATWAKAGRGAVAKPTTPPPALREPGGYAPPPRYVERVLDPAAAAEGRAAALAVRAQMKIDSAAAAAAKAAAADAAATRKAEERLIMQRLERGEIQ